MYTILDFENKSEIPLIILQSILKNCLKPEEIRFGQMKKLKSNDFYQKIVGIINLKEIKVLDFSMYSELNDEILMKCLEKTNLSLLNELNLPYSCKITNKSLLFLEENVKNLGSFHLDSKYSRESNKNLDQSTLAKIIIRNQDLGELCLETVNCDFMQTLNQNNFTSDHLIILKIRNLELKDFKDLKNILAFGSCKHLICFTIKEIFVRNKFINYDHEDILENFEKLFKNLDHLKHIKLGHFATPALLDVISENVPTLEMFKVVSEHLEIEDLEGFFFSCINLMTLEGKVGPEYNFVHFEKRKIIFIF